VKYPPGGYLMFCMIAFLRIPRFVGILLLRCFLFVLLARSACDKSIFKKSSDPHSNLDVNRQIFELQSTPFLSVAKTTAY